MCIWQVKYNVLDTSPEASGLLRKCQDLDVTLVAHSPLQQGILTGKQSVVHDNECVSGQSEDTMLVVAMC